MNIKQSIFTLLLLMGVSFSAFSSSSYYSLRSNFPECGLNDVTMNVTESFLQSLAPCTASKLVMQDHFYAPKKYWTLKTCFLASVSGGKNIRCSFTNTSKSIDFIRARKYTCPDDEVFNSVSGECEPPPPTCTDLKNQDAPWPTGNIPDDGRPITAQRRYCVTSDQMCEAQAGYLAIGGVLTKDSFYTGDNCSPDFTGNENCQYMGTTCDAPPPPGPELEDPYPGCKKPYPEVPFVCPEDTDGDGIPNPDAPFDEGANCTYDKSGKFSCTGGSFDPETPKDPTNGIDDPSPFDPVTSNPVNPNPTDPEEDVEPVPDSGNGNGDIVTAITNQNRDINSSLHSLNVANNKNFAEVNTKLNQLDLNTKAINKNIGLQLKQDIEIYEQNKKLQLQATQETSRLLQQSDTLRGTQIGNQTSALTGAIGGQTTALKGAIDGQTQAITGALDGLEGAIDKLTDKIPEQCEPTPDNNYCENPHGLDVGYVETLFSQMDDSVDGMMSGASSTLVNTAQSTIDAPLTTEAESVVNDSVAILMDVIGINKSCTPLVLGSHNGTNIQISCQVSEQIKMILSFLLGVYTLMTLLDILLDGITPLGSKPSATRYA